MIEAAQHRQGYDVARGVNRATCCIHGFRNTLVDALAAAECQLVQACAVRNLGRGQAPVPTASPGRKQDQRAEVLLAA